MAIGMQNSGTGTVVRPPKRQRAIKVTRVGEATKATKGSRTTTFAKANGVAKVREAKTSHTNYSESGRISLLILGLALLVVALVLASAAATTVHVQRRQLLTCADAVSLSVAGVASASDYYEGQADPILQSDLNRQARTVFNQLQATTCDVGTSRNITDVAVRNNAVEIRMAMTPELPVFGKVLDFINQPLTISVASLAKMH